MMQDDEGRLVEALAITLYGDIGPGEWDEVGDDSKDMCRFNVKRILSAIEREGFRVVPVEPTENMMGAYVEHGDAKRPMEDVCRERWSAMLSAAPKQG